MIKILTHKRQTGRHKARNQTAKHPGCASKGYIQHLLNQKRTTGLDLIFFCQFSQKLKSRRQLKKKKINAIRNTINLE